MNDDFVIIVGDKDPRLYCSKVLYNSDHVNKVTIRGHCKNKVTIAVIRCVLVFNGWEEIEEETKHTFWSDGSIKYYSYVFDKIPALVAISEELKNDKKIKKIIEYKNTTSQSRQLTREVLNE